MANAKGLSLRGGQRPTWQSRSSRLHRGKVTGEIATAFPRLPRRFAPRNDTSGGYCGAPAPSSGLIPLCKALNERRYRRNRSVRFYRHLVRTGSAFPRLPRRFAPRNDTSGRHSDGNGAAHRIGGTTAASRTGLAVPAPTGPVRIERRLVQIGNAFPRLPRPLWGLAMTRQGSAAMGTVRRTELAVLLPLRGRAWLSPPLQGQCGLNDGRRMIHSSFFIIHYFIHPPAGDGKPYDKTSGNSLPFVQISPEPPDLSLTTGAFIDKIISENKGAVCPLQQARQPTKNLFVTHDPNTRDQYRRTTQWIKNASLP